jgi:PAS domain-containing protein
LQVLAETGTVAMLTVDERGVIVFANLAAVEFLAPRDRRLVGRPVAGFFPALHYALRWEDAPQFRTSMECRGHRHNGQPFLARVWLSGFMERNVPRVSAIIVETSELWSTSKN